jgi:hypothetical protein
VVLSLPAVSRCVLKVSGRIQRIIKGDCVSRDSLVTSIVPRSSYLGPLCFIWFVNEIGQIFENVRVLFYADDMKLFLPVVRDFRDCLKIRPKWCSGWVC